MAKTEETKETKKSDLMRVHKEIYDLKLQGGYLDGRPGCYGSKLVVIHDTCDNGLCDDCKFSKECYEDLEYYQNLYSRMD